MGKPPSPESDRHDGEDEASREQEPLPMRNEANSFRSLMKRLLAVPRDELADQEERWKAERDRRPR